MGGVFYALYSLFLLYAKLRAMCGSDSSSIYLTHFSPVLHFYTPWKRQKTFGFLTSSGGIEMWHWTKTG